MINSNMTLSYNPFNPLKTYRAYSARTQEPIARQNSIQINKNGNVPQQNYYALLIRNQQNKGLKSDQHFNAYIKKLEDNCKMSKKLILNTKNFVKLDIQKQQDEEIQKKTQKQQQQFRPSAKSQKTLKFQHQITEMITEIKSPTYKKGRYLINEDKDREKKLAKPLFFGVQNQAKQNYRKKQIYSHIDISKLRYKIFFDDYNPLQRITTSQQSMQREESIEQQSPQLIEQIKQIFD